MKSNPLVKFLVIPFAIMALFVVVKLFSKDSSEKQAQAPETLVLSTGEAKNLALTAIPPATRCAPSSWKADSSKTRCPMR